MKFMEIEVRKIINDGKFYDEYFKNHLDKWNILCASMDTIEDTTLAINQFEEEGIKKDDRNKYLGLYGLLQAVFLQQNAIKSLLKVIQECLNGEGEFKKFEDYKSESWKKIREYRHLSIAHPTKNKSFKKGHIKRAMISRISISSEGFKVLCWDKKNNNPEEVKISLRDLLREYRTDVKIILLDLENFLRNHKFSSSNSD